MLAVSLLLLYGCGSLFVLGLIFLLICLLVVYVFVVFGYFWYALLFFIVYVGGLLILFFYLLSLHSNSFGYYSISGCLFFLFISLYFFSIFSLCCLDSYFFYMILNCSYSLFTGFEFIWLFYIFSFLLLVLFYISVFTSVCSCPLRSLFG
uniref:NADH dehydrogenase subunit 6 n=2 Tax=Girardia TaxID=52316 RepID=A0A8F2IVH3_GIRTI|nr:NADH dehydrogenase subunit 6 [Girardia tigrina]